MFQHQTFRLLAGSLFFLALCQGVNQLLNPPIICNEGIGLGINLPVSILIPLIIFSLIIAVFLIQTIFQNETVPPILVSFGGAFLIGGALSNITDRFTRGCIPDFFALGWFPAFNMADICISGGAILLLVAILKK